AARFASRGLPCCGRPCAERGRRAAAGGKPRGVARAGGCLRRSPFRSRSDRRHRRVRPGSHGDAAAEAQRRSRLPRRDEISRPARSHRTPGRPHLDAGFPTYRAPDGRVPQDRRIPAMRRLAALGALVCVTGCASLEYYAQAVGGHLEVIRLADPIEERLRETDAPEPLRVKLARALAIREFASRELALPDNGSYRRYADLGRPFVVWNVVAAPEFSVEPLESCFPFAGCVSYRGYYSEEAARAYAAALAEKGYDVHVGGVPAYSTLGWFDDPLLSTFIHYPEAELARIVCHELAQQTVYTQGGTTF